jgi:RNA polymerase sigma factor (sigma-70 family)
MENITDKELIDNIQKNQDYLGVVYKKCKKYCIKFMQNMTSNKFNDYELEDIFQDAIIVFYEKIIKDDFVLTASIQTYLNSVCRFQLLNKLGKDKNNFSIEANFNGDDDDENVKYLSSITDGLEPIEDEKENQFIAIETALEKMKSFGSHCYELLTLYWYHKKPHAEIAEIMNYSNDKTSKKQKSVCQEKLRKMAFNELQN